MVRHKTRKIRTGDMYIGGDAPVSVQSMTNTDTRDWKETVCQIRKLESSGCEIVRVAVPDMEAARMLGVIKRKIGIPLVADVHFDFRLAVEAISQGVDKVRINPGNIGSREKVESIITAAKRARIPVRIGVNSGSLKTVGGKGGTGAEEMVSSALGHIKIFENLNFHDIVISLKASSLADTVSAYRLMASKCHYPLHLGITAAGLKLGGTVKSSIGLGILLSEGIGDTLRVSLTADPAEEVRVGKEILKALGLRKEGLEIVSCPTCGRCEIDIIGIAEKVEKGLKGMSRQVRVAVMGCAVNGPGEAREADIGIAGGRRAAVLFRKGKVIRKIREKDIAKTLIREVRKLRK